MTRLFLHLWNLAATFRNSSSGKKNTVTHQICVVPYSYFGNWIVFGPLRRRCIFYIWTAFTLLITVYTFAVVIILLHIWVYSSGSQSFLHVDPQLRYTIFCIPCFLAQQILMQGSMCHINLSTFYLKCMIKYTIRKYA